MKLAQLYQLKPYFNDRQWLVKTMNQLNKDLTMIGMPAIEEAVPDTLKQLAQILSPYFDNIIKYKPHKWAEFLYRIDLPENMLHEAMNDETEEEVTVASYILKRELFKVYALSLIHI